MATWWSSSAVGRFLGRPVPSVGWIFHLSVPDMPSAETPGSLWGEQCALDPALIAVKQCTKPLKTALLWREKKIPVGSSNVDVCDCYIHVCLSYIYEVWKEQLLGMFTYTCTGINIFCSSKLPCLQ